MSSIVWFNIPAHGHTNPTLEVVRRLVGRGHQVRYYSFLPFRDTVEGTGAEFVPCDAFLPPPPRDLDQRAGQDFSSMFRMVTTVTLAMEARVRADLTRQPPDCVVYDSQCIWGKLYAQKLGLPAVCSTTTFAFNRDTARLMRPSGQERRYLLLGLPRMLWDLSKLRRRGYAITDLGALLGNDDCTPTLVYTSRLLQPRGEELGENYTFVGPSLPPLPARERAGERPLVYLSLGTVLRNRADFFRACVEGLRNCAWDVVLSVGDQETRSALGPLPPHIRAFPRVDQLQTLSRAHVFVTHCGMNSVSESICLEVPMVLYPQQSEQQVVAHRVQTLGAGLPLTAATPEGIRKAVEEVLAHRTAYLTALAPIARSFHEAGGPDRAADVIERTAQMVRHCS